MRETFEPRPSLSRLLPSRFVRFVRLMRELTWEERRKYVELGIGRRFRRRPLAVSLAGGGTMRILVVCHGNIMRSPYAAALLSDLARKSGQASQCHVESAGVLAAPGRRADPRAQAWAARRGLSLERHVSSPLWADVVHASDLILVMDSHNEVVLLTRYPEQERKVVMLGSFGARQRGEREEIDDPFGAPAEVSQAIFERIDRAVEALWRHVRHRQQQPPTPNRPASP